MKDVDITFINAVAKSREKNVLDSDRLNRMIEQPNPKEALKILKEVNFGGDVAIEDVFDFEKLINEEEKYLVEFIKEYAPQKLKPYLLAENDFHNAECVLRKTYQKDFEDIFLTEGLYSLAQFENFINLGVGNLPKEIKDALSSCKKLFEENKESGFQISNIFTKALFLYKLNNCFDSKIKKLLKEQINLKNISIALRSKNVEIYNKTCLGGGTLKESDVNLLISSDNKTILERYEDVDTKYALSLAISSLNNKKPMVEFENYCDSLLLKNYKKTMYETSGLEPFIIYCLYKKNEINNVRLIMVGLVNGQEKGEIKRRLRENYAG